MKKTPQRHPASPAAKPRADTTPLKTECEEELVLLRMNQRSKSLSQTVTERRGEAV